MERAERPSRFPICAQIDVFLRFIDEMEGQSDRVIEYLANHRGVLFDNNAIQTASWFRWSGRGDRFQEGNLLFKASLFGI